MWVTQLARRGGDSQLSRKVPEGIVIVHMQLL